MKQIVRCYKCKSTIEIDWTPVYTKSRLPKTCPVCHEINIIVTDLRVKATKPKEKRMRVGF